MSIIATDAENVITTSAKECSNDLCGSVDNPSDPLPQHSVHKHSTKTSLSSDLEYVNQIWMESILWWYPTLNHHTASTSILSQMKQTSNWKTSQSHECQLPLADT